MRPAVTELQALVGRTIERVDTLDESVVLGFVDGTYARIRSSAFGECSICDPELVELAEPSYSGDAQKLLDLGIWDAAEFQAWGRRYEASQAAHRRAGEAADRRTYEKLKAKFSGDER